MLEKNELFFDLRWKDFVWEKCSSGTTFTIEALPCLRKVVKGNKISG